MSPRFGFIIVEAVSLCKYHILSPSGMWFLVSPCILEFFPVQHFFGYKILSFYILSLYFQPKLRNMSKWDLQISSNLYRAIDLKYKFKTLQNLYREPLGYLSQRKSSISSGINAN